MRRTRRARERGAVFMEFALTLPLLILIVMLVLEGSRLVRTHQILNNAAREGARLSSLQANQGQPAGIITQVVNYAAENGVSISSTEVTINQSVLIPTASGISISASQVTIDHPYTVNYLTVFTWLGVPATYTLEGRAVFRNLI